MAAKKKKTAKKFNKAARIRELFEADQDINAAGVMEKDKRFTEDDRKSLSAQISKLRSLAKKATKAPKAALSTSKPSIPAPAVSRTEAEFREAIAGAYADGYSAGLRARK
jgi:hypothetical protein